MRSSEKLEHLNPLVERIAQIEFIIGVDKDSRGKPELALSGSPSAYGQQEFSMVIEQLNIIEKVVDDINGSGFVDGNTFGHGKVP
jgi:hypothetical protein